MLICKICGHKGKQLHQHLKKCHDMISSEYRNLYGQDLKMQTVSEKSKRKRAETVKRTGGTIWSVKYWIARGMTESEAKNKVSEIQKNNNSRREYLPEHIIINKQYWMQKHGYTEDQAIEKVRSIQADRSSRSSKFSGKQHTAESRTQIGISMSKHIQEVGVDNWIKRFGELSNGLSKSEIECYNLIREQIEPKLQSQIEILDYVADMGIGFKIIEFHGDYWHANPMLFEADQEINYPGNNTKLAKDKWAEDAKRYATFISLGFEILVIWEHDWNNDRERIIEQVKDFLS